MRKRILVGLLFFIILEIVTGVVFYIISSIQDDYNIFLIDIIKMIFVASLFFVFMNISVFFMIWIGFEKYVRKILWIFSYGLIFGFIFCVIIAFSDYFSITGIFFLIPVFISCIIWRKVNL
jgi:hypothetical protein